MKHDHHDDDLAYASSLMSKLAYVPRIASLTLAVVATCWLTLSSSEATTAASTATPKAGSAAKPGAVAAQAVAAASSAFRELRWAELVPKEWDPLKRFRARGMGMVGDGDPRADDMMAEMRAAWDNAPIVSDLDGAKIRIAGYIVPLEEVRGELKEFLLVPYFGACIHTPPPPANQIVFVVPKGSMKGLHAMDTVWVSGLLSISRQDSFMGASGYKLEATLVERYVPPAR